jgi:hypothetical protein
MNEQSYAVSYQAAMDAATTELSGLFEEAKRLRNRIEQVDAAIGALKPLLTSPGIGSELNPTMQQIDSVLGTVLA